MLRFRTRLRNPPTRTQARSRGEGRDGVTRGLCESGLIPHLHRCPLQTVHLSRPAAVSSDTVSRGHCPSVAQTRLPTCWGPSIKHPLG